MRDGSMYRLYTAAHFPYLNYRITSRLQMSTLQNSSANFTHSFLSYIIMPWASCASCNLHQTRWQSKSRNWMLAYGIFSHTMLLQAANCGLLALQTTDVFTSNPRSTAAIDNSTCMVQYTSDAQYSSLQAVYDGQASLNNGSLRLSTLNSVGPIDPSRTFVIPELKTYSAAGAQV